jgi:hypothetical protein
MIVILVSVTPLVGALIAPTVSCVTVPLWLILGLVVLLTSRALINRHQRGVVVLAGTLAVVGAGVMGINVYYAYATWQLVHGDWDYQQGPGLDVLRNYLIQAPSITLALVLWTLAGGAWLMVRRCKQ